VAFLRRRRQRLSQQNSAEDTSPHQLLIELYTFWRVLSTIEYRKYSLGVRYSIYNPKYSFQFVHNFSLCKVDEIRYNKPA
jgi:hypothetical protein